MPSVYDGGLPVVAWGRQYKIIAANTALAPIDATGAAGDDLDQLWLLFATNAPGAVVVSDGAALPVWTWPAGIVPATLSPVFIPLNLKAVNVGGWWISTGANVSVLASGRFT